MVDSVAASTDLHALSDIDHVGESWEPNSGKSTERCRAESASLLELTRGKTRSLFLLAITHSAILVIYFRMLHIKQRSMAILLTSDLH